MNARRWLMLIVMVMTIFNQTISASADENVLQDASFVPVATGESATPTPIELLSLVESTPTEVLPTETPVPIPTPTSPPGSCTITATPREEKNIFDFQVTLPDTNVYTVDFGDQASDPGVVGPSGTTWHGYSYTPGGLASYTASVIGLGCQTDIVIDDTATPDPTPEDDPLPAPSGNGGGREDLSFQETPTVPSGCRNGNDSPRVPEQGMLVCWHSATNVEIWANRPFNIQLGLGGAVLAGSGEPELQHLQFEDTSSGHFILWGQEVGIRFRADGSLVNKAFEPIAAPGP